MRRALIAATLCSALPPHLSFVQALKSVAHGKHLVALGDSHPDGGSHGGVHARRGGAHVQHGHVEGALRVTEGSWSHTDKHTRASGGPSQTHTRRREPDSAADCRMATHSQHANRQRLLDL